MTMTELSAPLRETSADQPQGSISQTALGLVFDDTIAGLTLDEVSVVAVGDRPVVVPLSRELAESTGFTILSVPEESLFSIGVLPVRAQPNEPVEPVEPVSELHLPTFEPDIDEEPEAVDEGPVEPKPVIATNWFEAPTPKPSQEESGDALSPDVLPTEVTAPERVMAPTLSTVSVAADSTAAPPRITSMDFDLPAPVARSLSEVPVEPARPIRSMAAAHRDWEPEQLGWPYVERRSNDELTPAAPVVMPRSLSSGRPVNGEEPRELVVGQPIEPTNSSVIVVQSAGTESIRPLNLRVAGQSFVVVSGGRGSGKSSLLRMLAGFDAPLSGTASVDGVDLVAIDADDRAVREAVSAGFIPQSPFLVPDLSVAENVSLPLLAQGVPATMATGVATDALQRVGLHELGDVQGALASGAELRLVAEARAMVSSPLVLFADEPFSGLGDDDAVAVLHRLHEFVASGGTVVMACTDPRVRLLGVRHLVLRGGLVVSDDTATSMLG